MVNARLVRVGERLNEVTLSNIFHVKGNLLKQMLLDGNPIRTIRVISSHEQPHRFMDGLLGDFHVYKIFFRTEFKCQAPAGTHITYVPMTGSEVFITRMHLPNGAQILVWPDGDRPREAYNNGASYPADAIYYLSVISWPYSLDFGNGRWFLDPHILPPFRDRSDRNH